MVSLTMIFFSGIQLIDIALTINRAKFDPYAFDSFVYLTLLSQDARRSSLVLSALEYGSNLRVARHLQR